MLHDGRLPGMPAEHASADILAALRPARDTGRFRHDLPELDDATCRILRALRHCPRGRTLHETVTLAAPLTQTAVTARLDRLEQDGLVTLNPGRDTLTLTGRGQAAFTAEAARRARARTGGS